MDNNPMPKLCLNIETNIRPKPIYQHKETDQHKQPENVEKRKRNYEEDEVNDVSKLCKRDGVENEEGIPPDSQAVSSLFTGNPDIPYIPNQNIEKVVEKVFSEDSFGSLNIAYQIVSNLEKVGFKSMTMVQKLSIPHLLDNKDALIKSQTGSGKTLAYAVPIVHKIMSMEPRITRSEGIYAIIIVPTRELAIQSYNWFESLCKSCVWVVPGYLIGGEKKKSEKKRLKKGVNILVATPGRLIDHIHHTKSLSLHNIQYFVIDEADRLLEMGYEQSITSIVESINEKSSQDISNRQTIMLSATLSPDVQKLAGINLTSPVTVDVSSSTNEDLNGNDPSQLMTDVLVTPENLSHYYILVPAKLRLVCLAAFIISNCRFGNERKMLIFMATQDMVDFHTSVFKYFLTRFGKEKKKVSSLSKRAHRVLEGMEDDGSGDDSSGTEEDSDDDQDDEEPVKFLQLHGNMTQQDRSLVFKTFKAADAGVLLCTDVAARGLDLPAVNWIVQYNAACSVADYVHRVGRTARVNTKGSALAFLSPSESSYISWLQDYKIIIKEKKMENILKGLLHTSTQGRRPTPQQAIEAATSLQLKIENLILSDKELHMQAKKGYISFVRSYASYPKDVREMFNFKSLHLGHYAKCFGLRDTPSALGASSAYRAKKDLKEYHEKKEKRRQINVMKQKSGSLAPKYATMSEFDSGLDQTTIRKLTNHKKFDKGSSFSKINKVVGKKSIQTSRKREPKTK